MDREKLKFNKNKFEEVILYLISLYPEKEIEGKKKLAKLLYFADFNYFEAYDLPITGANYRALPMGPVPDQLEETLKEMRAEKIIQSSKEIGLPNKIEVFRLKQENISFKHLNKKEKNVLDKIFKDYGGLSGKKLEDLSHAEAPYNSVVEGEHMPYELAYYRGNNENELINI